MIPTEIADPLQFDATFHVSMPVSDFIANEVSICEVLRYHAEYFTLKPVPVYMAPTGSTVKKRYASIGIHGRSSP